MSNRGRWDEDQAAWFRWQLSRDEPGPERLSAAKQQVRDQARTQLTDYLTKEQKSTWLLAGYIDVVSNRGRTWRISTSSTVKNVTCIRAQWWCFWMRGVKYCAHSAVLVPNELTFISQYLTLKTNERAFRRVAHRWFP